SPTASQTKSLIQLSRPSENINPPLTSTPMIETNGANGVRNGRATAGSVLLRIQTAAETITNANSVPMLTRSARKLSGARAPPTATTRPTRIVDFQGVLKRGWTAPEKDTGHQTRS